MTAQQFKRGWEHFLDCINFNHSTLDAEAIGFMNTMPGKVFAALKNQEPKKKTEERKSEQCQPKNSSTKFSNA